MQDLTYNLCALVNDGSIDAKDAYKYAPNIEELKNGTKKVSRLLQVAFCRI